MKKNAGGLDRIVRISAGLGLIAFGIYSQNPWFAIGIIPLFTGLVGWCPLYPILGVSTCCKK